MKEKASLKPRSAAIRRPTFSTSSTVSITHESNAHIILPSSASHASKPCSLTSLKSCAVDMSVLSPQDSAPFAGLTIKNVKGSLLVCGIVSGPAHITGAEDSVIVVTCRQFRMHECKNVDVYLSCSSRPIIEDCSGIRFAQLPDTYVSIIPPFPSQNPFPRDNMSRLTIYTAQSLCHRTTKRTPQRHHKYRSHSHLRHTRAIETSIGSRSLVADRRLQMAQINPKPQLEPPPTRRHSRRRCVERSRARWARLVLRRYTEGDAGVEVISAKKDRRCRGWKPGACYFWWAVYRPRLYTRTEIASRRGWTDGWIGTVRYSISRIDGSEWGGRRLLRRPPDIERTAVFICSIGIQNLGF